MKKIYFVRHGESESNVNKIMSGSGDNAILTANGRMQVKVAGQKLKNKNIELIVASPMIRTVDTAKIIAEEIGYHPKSIVKNPLFIERSYGIYDGKPDEKYIKDRDEGKIHPSVETEEQMYERLKKAMDWLNTLPEERIIVVGHGGVRRAIYVINENLHHSHMWKLDSFPNAEIYEFQL